jgi:hypothetical protein
MGRCDACKHSREPPVCHTMEQPHGKAAPLQGCRARAGLFRESTLKTESNGR